MTTLNLEIVFVGIFLTCLKQILLFEIIKCDD